MTTKTHTFPPRVEDLDDYIMKWGKYQGKPLILIPADYLLWIDKNTNTKRPLSQYFLYAEHQLRKEVMEGIIKCPMCEVRWDGIKCISCGHERV